MIGSWFILGSKSLDTLPPHVLGFRLQLMRFHYKIHHVPGKTLYTADTLSRPPINELSSDTASCSPEEIEKVVQEVTATLPAGPDRLNSYCNEDSICSKLIQYYKSGWPARNQLSREMKEHWRYRGELTLRGNLLLFQSRIVVPTSMRQMTLEKIHEGYQGIQ